jgi:hypothetical protein
MNPDTKISIMTRIIDPLSVYYKKPINIIDTSSYNHTKVMFKVEGIENLDVFSDICEGKTGLNVYIISELTLDKENLEVGYFTTTYAGSQNISGKRSDRFQRIFVDSKGKFREYHPSLNTREDLRNAM